VRTPFRARRSSAHSGRKTARPTRRPARRRSTAGRPCCCCHPSRVSAAWFHENALIGVDRTWGVRCLNRPSRPGRARIARRLRRSLAARRRVGASILERRSQALGLISRLAPERRPIGDPAVAVDGRLPSGVNRGTYRCRRST
jgi:hypothetical protein